MAANGLMYSAQFTGVTVTSATQDIWELVAAAGVSVVVHKIIVTFTPTIVSGVAQDVRGSFQLVERSTTGSGGVAATPAGTNPRNSVAAATTTTRTVTTPGTIGEIRWSDGYSVIVPYVLDFYKTDLLEPISGGGRLCLFMQTALGSSFVANSTVIFEEI